MPRVAAAPKARKVAQRWPTLRYERRLWQQGVAHIAGADEAGRGALAGPVYAAAVILPSSIARQLKGVRDSKQMTAAEREELAPRIKQYALAWAVASASVEEIEEINILQASHLATRRALEALSIPPQHLLLDAVHLTAVDLPQTPLVGGDARCLTISAASVLAKTARDAELCRLDAEFPHYGFAEHKGYATPAHREAIAAHGPCVHHRRSFAPMRAV
ncbi:MAG: ribonuclease HII [Anaerolineales bacterium]|nr:MAG: ribonuclease HII [Anaerolineales bacterium]